jgi:hypothetical protein
MSRAAANEISRFRRIHVQYPNDRVKDGIDGLARASLLRWSSNQTWSFTGFHD